MIWKDIIGGHQRSHMAHYASGRNIDMQGKQVHVTASWESWCKFVIIIWSPVIDFFYRPLLSYKLIFRSRIKLGVALVTFWIFVLRHIYQVYTAKKHL